MDGRHENHARTLLEHRFIQSNTKRLEESTTKNEGHHKVGWLWKRDHPSWPYNQSYVINRPEATEKRLKCDQQCIRITKK